MLGVFVTVPVACFRRGLAREYLETEAIPPPSTCYGFLLSLVGETDRLRHVGCRISPVLVGTPSQEYRDSHGMENQDEKAPDGRRAESHSRTTGTPDEYPPRCVVGLGGRKTGSSPFLEERVRTALTRPESGRRFGGLSLGESTHLVDEVNLFSGSQESGSIFVLSDHGRLTLPVWVDHVGSRSTRYVTGDLVTTRLTPPDAARLPQIEPAQ